MEGRWCAHSQELLKFSEQQLVDCDYGTGIFSNHGCNGGNLQRAFKYFNSKSEMKEEDYPYVSGKTKKNGTC